jgi:hypothetical protein
VRGRQPWRVGTGTAVPVVAGGQGSPSRPPAPLRRFATLLLEAGEVQLDAQDLEGGEREKKPLKERKKKKETPKTLEGGEREKKPLKERKKKKETPKTLEGGEREREGSS